MKSTICDDMPEMISLYLDDDLDELARTRVRRHATQCAMCGPLFIELQAVDTLFKNAPVVAAPEGFTLRTVEAVYQADFQENLRFGVVTLLLSTITFLAFLLWGNAPFLLNITTVLLNPTSFTGMEQWLPQLLEILQVFGRVALSIFTGLGEVLAAPLALTLVAGLIASIMLNVILKRTRIQMTM